MNTYVHLRYLGECFFEWEVYGVKFVEAIETYILCSIIFFFGNHSFNEIMWEKYGTARQDREDNMLRRRQDAISMSDN